MKNSVIEKITQLFLIVFSVVLGLYLSERIEDRKNEKEAAKLLSKIKSELNDNKKLLDIWVPYHMEVARNLDSLVNSEKFVENFINDRSTLYGVFTKGTILSDMPSNDAWDIAKSHPLIVNFEYDELLILSKIYNQQKFTFEPVPKLVELILTLDFNSKENAKSNLDLFKNKLRDIANRELQLINYYKDGESILKFQDN